MDTLFQAGEIAAEPPAVPETLQGKAAVLTADPVVVAYPFRVIT
jgi:hypothetical protein